MRTRPKLLVIALVALVGVLVFWGGNWLWPKKITVVVDAPLMSKLIFDPSDMDAARFYFEENPESRLQLKELYYDFNPETSAPRFEEAIKDGHQFFVTTQPSSTLVQSAYLFADRGPLVINTSATSPTMTGKDDYMLRIIADAQQEQQAIADYINTLPGSRLLVLQDSANAAYTDPGFKHFVRQLGTQGRWQVTHERFEFETFTPENLAAIMSEPFDALYVLGGDFQASMGNIVQLFYQKYPNAPIVLTPWARSNAIFEMAGPAINNLVLVSHHPSKAADPAIADYLKRFHARFGYQPMAMALMVRQALEILEQAVSEGYNTPEQVRQFLLSQPELKTSLGDIRFDEFGDMQQTFHPIKNLDAELRNP